MSTNYERAHVVLGGIEGAYSNNASDPGGETWAGIARNYWRQLALWKIIDSYKTRFGGVTNACLAAMKADKELAAQVYAFYKQEFWDVWGCDSLPYELALELFEQSINLGVGGSAKNLYIVLNYLNYAQQFGDDLVPAKGISNAMRQRLDAVMGSDLAIPMQYAMNGQQYLHYRNNTVANPKKRLYFKGWVRARCSATKFVLFPDKMTMPDIPVIDYSDTRNRIYGYVEEMKALPGVTDSGAIGTALSSLYDAATGLMVNQPVASRVTTQITPAGVLSINEMRQHEYWAAWGADNLPTSLAEEIVGQSIAIELDHCTLNLQTTLNAMNYTSSKGIYGYGKDLKPDGILGNNTKGRLQQLIDAGHAETVQYGLNGEQYAFYCDQIIADPTKRKDWRDWVTLQCSAEYHQ